MLRGPKKDGNTIKALEVLQKEHESAKSAYFQAIGDTIAKEEAKKIINDFNEKFINMGGDPNFAVRSDF